MNNDADELNNACECEDSDEIDLDSPEWKAVIKKFHEVWESLSPENRIQLQYVLEVRAGMRPDDQESAPEHLD
jgi:hypothetical protein